MKWAAKWLHLLGSNINTSLGIISGIQGHPIHLKGGYQPFKGKNSARRDLMTYHSWGREASKVRS